MENIIKYVVECDSLYGLIALVFFCTIIFAIIHFVVPYLYKALCKICNTIVKYKNVHAKASVKDISFETELHR